MRKSPSKSEQSGKVHANAIPKKESAGTFQFQDLRSEATVQRKLRQLAENSPQVQAGAVFQAKVVQHFAADSLPADAQTKPIQKAANHTGLPDQLKSGIEGLSGMSMDHVRVHYNSPKPATLQAHAYAQGSHIHLAPSQEKHLPHEAWHVVQQAQGRVKPTMQLKGVGINANEGLEREADAMGAKARRGPTLQLHLLPQPATPHNPPVQRVVSSWIGPLANFLGVDATNAAVATALNIGVGALLAGLAIVAVIGLFWGIPKIIAYLRGDAAPPRSQQASASSGRSSSASHSAPTFVNPTSLPELQRTIDARLYPHDVVSRGQREDWAGKQARRLRAKKPDEYIMRVRRVEGFVPSGSSEPAHYEFKEHHAAPRASVAATEKVKRRAAPAAAAAAGGPAAVPDVLPIHYGAEHGDLHFIARPTAKKSAWTIAQPAALTMMEQAITHRMADIIAAAVAARNGRVALLLIADAAGPIGDSVGTRGIHRYQIQLQADIHGGGSISYHGFPDDRAAHTGLGPSRNNLH